jgi:hypothetical protein
MGIPGKERCIQNRCGAPDVHGMPVNIVADVHGYYVFIYEFHGDDRASPVASSYMDAWERVRVLEDPPPPAATLTTKASPGRRMSEMSASIRQR